MPQKIFTEHLTPFISPPLKNKGKELEDLYPSKSLLHCLSAVRKLCLIFMILKFIYEFEMLHSDYSLGYNRISRSREIFSVPSLEFYLPPQGNQIKLNFCRTYF